MNDDRRLVSGVELEAVRVRVPTPHWRVKVVATGHVLPPGIFCGQSKRKLWQSVEDTASRRGESWVQECMDAHLPH